MATDVGEGGWTVLIHMRALTLAGLIGLSALAFGCETNGSGPYGSQSSMSNSNRETATMPAQVTASDREFAMKAAMGGKHEVELGRLAADRASNSDVKAFANRMIEDHSRAGDDLMQVNSRLGITGSSDDEASFQQVVTRLSSLKGIEFDRAYMSEMVDDHTKDVAEIENYANNGNNPDLKAWASKTLPTVRDHLQIAQSLAAKVGAAK